MLIITVLPPPSKHIHFSPHPEALRPTGPCRDVLYSSLRWERAGSAAGCMLLASPETPLPGEVSLTCDVHSVSGCFSREYSTAPINY